MSHFFRTHVASINCVHSFPFCICTTQTKWSLSVNRSVCRNGFVEITVIFCVDTRLQECLPARGGRLCRLRLREQTNQEERINHGCPDSSMTMN